MPKRVLIGTVVSDKADKTVTVRVDRRVKHPLYGKIIRRSKKYHAHDADNVFRMGEQVRIEECKPISKSKAWTVIERIGAAKAVAVEIDEPDAIAAPEKESKTEAKAETPVEPKAEAKAEAEPKAEKADKPEKKVEKKADKKAEPKAEKAEKPAKAKETKAKGKAKAKADDTAGAKG
jgi:small subunit ribosomal protein S17